MRIPLPRIFGDWKRVNHNTLQYRHTDALGIKYRIEVRVVDSINNGVEERYRIWTKRHGEWTAYDTYLTLEDAQAHILWSVEHSTTCLLYTSPSPRDS